MSHFTVLVVGENPEKQLAPYHEFECTGRNDEYVVDVDITEKVRDEFTKGTTRRYRDPTGALYRPSEDRFYRPMTEEEQAADPFRAKFNPRVPFCPEGWAEVQVPYSEVKTLAQYAEDEYGAAAVPVGGGIDREGEHKFGYMLLDEKGEVVKIVDRTNPKKKWDWYLMGGRWTGYFKLKPGVDSRVGAVGEPGLMTGAAAKGHVDQARLCDIDLAGMCADVAKEAAARFDKVEPAFRGREIPSWPEIRDRHGEANFNAAREEHNSHPVVCAMLEIEPPLFMSGDLRDEFCVGDRDRFIERACRRAVATFAVVKDGQWFERGRMGWFAAVANEKDGDQWAEWFDKMLETLPPETLLSIYDCHI